MKKSIFAAVMLCLCMALTGCGMPSKADAPQDDGFAYLNAVDERFAIGGIEHPSENQNEFFRLDAARKSDYSHHNEYQAHNTAGVTLRFCTDADEIALRTQLRYTQANMLHFTPRGAFGFDVYVGEGTHRVYCGAPMQMLAHEDGFTDYIALPEGEKEVQISLPMYAGVSLVEIGFPYGALIKPPAPRANGTICFYGSSITQGGCASRPGTAYPNIICRTLDADCMNLGFSGSAMGEQIIAEYIAGRDMAALVMEYDHNNTLEGLHQTHYAFYETVRRAHPDIPIVMLSQPVFTIPPSDEQLQRQAVVEETYRRAVEGGDENVYYLCGSDFFPDERIDLYTGDNLHPNDLGHYHMAEMICEVLEEALDK